MARFKNDDVLDLTVGEKTEKVKVIHVTPDDPFQPRYLVQFVAGKSKYLRTHAWESQLEIPAPEEK